MIEHFARSDLPNADQYYSDHLLVPHPYLAEPVSVEILEAAFRKVFTDPMELRDIAFPERGSL